MLALVDELERNGAVRSISRASFRDIFAICWSRRSPGGDSRLVTASPSERAEMARIAADFSEEDLTRYLQLALDLFRDLQFSLQPRFHLEIGLLKMVQAGKLIAIEEALGVDRHCAGTCSGAPATANAPARSDAPALRRSRWIGSRRLRAPVAHRNPPHPLRTTTGA